MIYSPEEIITKETGIMSNPLNARRVQFQNLNEDGTPDGPPTFGVIVSDSSEMKVNNSFDSLDALNKEINAEGCIVDLVNGFAGDVDRDIVGTDNFYGKNWEKEN